MRDVSTSKVSVDTAVEDAGFFDDDDALLFLLENIFFNRFIILFTRTDN